MKLTGVDYTIRHSGLKQKNDKELDKVYILCVCKPDKTALDCGWNPLFVIIFGTRSSVVNIIFCPHLTQLV